MSAFDASRRLKNALLADLAMKELDKAGDHWLTEPLNDPEQWTDHLARQLGFRRRPPWHLQETLMVVVVQLDEVLQDWPPRVDLARCAEIVGVATKDLNAVEMLESILLGPARWSQSILDAGKVSGLRAQLLPILQKGLASEMHRMLESWIDWDIPKLESRRRAAREEAERERARQLHEERRPRKVGREREDRIKPPFVPKGKTY